MVFAFTSIPSRMAISLAVIPCGARAIAWQIRWSLCSAGLDVPLTSRCTATAGAPLDLVADFRIGCFELIAAARELFVGRLVFAEATFSNPCSGYYFAAISVPICDLNHIE